MKACEICGFKKGLFGIHACIGTFKKETYTMKELKKARKETMRQLNPYEVRDDFIDLVLSCFFENIKKVK